MFRKKWKPVIPISKNMNQRYIAGGGCLMVGVVGLYLNYILCVIFLLVGIGILVSDYRSKAPPFEII